MTTIYQIGRFTTVYDEIATDGNIQFHFLESPDICSDPYIYCGIMAEDMAVFVRKRFFEGGEGLEGVNFDLMRGARRFKGGYYQYSNFSDKELTDFLTCFQKTYDGLRVMELATPKSEDDN